MTYAVAVWGIPVARLLPPHWLELRRLACSPEMPHNGASAFLGWMARWFRTNEPRHERLISYQDAAVHAGTIYRASGWTDANHSLPGATWVRDGRAGRDRNGDGSSVKIRWEKSLYQEPKQ